MRTTTTEPTSARTTLRTACVAYVVVLSYLLVARDPACFLPGQGGLDVLSGNVIVVAHLLGFSVLTLLVLAARWPVPTWTQYRFLAAYGLGTELIQAFLPWRSAEMGDLLQDLAGIAAGSAVYYGLAAGVRRLREGFRRPRAKSSTDGSGNGGRN
jgi:hypothetical protein